MNPLGSSATCLLAILINRLRRRPLHGALSARQVQEAQRAQQRLHGGALQHHSEQGLQAHKEEEPLTKLQAAQVCRQG